MASNRMNRWFLTTALGLGAVSPGVHAHCYDEAATRYAVPASLLRAIAQVESGGNPNAMNRSQVTRTGNYDIGLMQINSTWLPRLAPFGITEARLLEPCTNVLVGAWVLRQHLARSGADWNGVGAYNAGCAKISQTQCAELRNRYSWRVYRALERIDPTATHASAPPSAPPSAPVGLGTPAKGVAPTRVFPPAQIGAPEGALLQRAVERVPPTDAGGPFDAEDGRPARRIQSVALSLPRTAWAAVPPATELRGATSPGKTLDTPYATQLARAGDSPLVADASDLEETPD